MLVGLGGCGFGVSRDLANKGAHEEATGKITDYVSGSPIYKLCTGSERMEGSSRFRRWWDQ